MFNRLPESNRRRQRRPGGLFVSTVVHLVVIALAVRATGLKAASGPTTERVDVVYRSPSLPMPAPKRLQPVPITRETGPAVPTLPPTTELPPVISAEITEGIPPAGAMDKLLEGAFRPVSVSGTGDPSAAPNVADGSPLPENRVEKVVVAIPGTEPRYPSMLQSAGIEGDVRTQFVVDTLGRVEKGSVQVLATSHDLFASAVRDALARARFKPAEAAGRKVRQLVEQTFTFRISR